MSDEWREAVAGGDAKKLSDLVLVAVGSKAETALSLLRSCVQLLLEKKTATSPPEGATSINGQALAPINDNNNDGSSSDITVPPALLTLENVQLLQPRGRFDLVFRRDGLTVTGKAGAAAVSWDDVRHIIRLPRPEGFNWGKALNPDDPAGSDLLAIPLKNPVPFRKSKTSLILLQPDPKAKHSEASIVLDDGVSHQVSGSQGTLVMSALKLLSGVRQVTPDRGLFASRDGKSFVKCYHGVNEGSLFPLKQGLLFMKPALFLPRSHIEEVVCGRGGSATTRYVDLVVGLEVEDEEGAPPAATQQEFSNIDREALPCLQSYIQDALVAPRQREVKRAAKAEATAAAAAAASGQQQATSRPNGATSSAPEAAVPSAAVAVSGGSSTAAAAAARPAGAPEGGGGGASAGKAVSQSCKMQQQQQQQEGEEEEEEEDDGDDESDEDFAPVEGDTDSDDDSGSDSDARAGTNDGSGSSSDDDNNNNDEEAASDDDGCDGDAGGDASGSNLAAERAEALKELDDLAREAAGGAGSGATGGAADGSGAGIDPSSHHGESLRAEGEGRKKRKRTVAEQEEEEDVDYQGGGAQVGDAQGEEDTESDGEGGAAARKRPR